MTGGLHRRGDTRAATWARTVRSLRRLAEKLRGHGFQVIEPPDLDTHPEYRFQSGSDHELGPL